jgi:hypothetical protein
VFGSAGGEWSYFGGYMIPEPAGVIVPEAWREVGAAGQPAFQGTWVNVGGGSRTAKFYKDPFGQVHLSGQVKSGTLTTVIFALPAGYRPLTQLEFAVWSNNAYGTALVGADGSVYGWNGSATSFSLDNVHFRAEQ